MNASISFAPTVTAWFHPSLTAATAYSMQRDAQTRQLVRTGDSTGAFRLPRRLFSTQTIAATTSFDPARAMHAWLGEERRASKVANFFQQFDLQYSRTLTSGFDGSPITPGLGYQWGLGGLDAFRSTGGLNATVAGLSDQATLATGLRLPHDLAFRTNAFVSSSENYTRRLDNTQAVIEGRQQRFPDVSVAWTTTGPWKLSQFISNIVFNGGYWRSDNVSFAPAETPGGQGDRRVNRTTTYPFRTSINWLRPGGLTTSFAYNLEHRVDSLGGSLTTSDHHDVTVDVSRLFRLPPSWSLSRSPVRGHVTWQQTTTTSFVEVSASDGQRRLADNGRNAISLNADSEFGPNLSFSLQASRVVTFDNNYNRRLSQFVMSIVFALQLNAGEIR